MLRPARIIMMQTPGTLGARFRPSRRLCPGARRGAVPATVPVVLALLLCAAAAGAAETSTTNLYGHLYTAMRDGSGFANSDPSPMNTLFPLGENDFSRGGSVLSVYAEPLEEAGCQLQFSLVLVSPWWGVCDPVYDVKSNEAWFFAYNSESQFSNSEEYLRAGGLDALPGGHQILKDIKLDTGKPVEAEFFMSADATAWFGWGKGCLPGLVLCPVDEELRNETLYQDLPWPYPSWNADYGVFPKWVVFSKVLAADGSLSADGDLRAMPNRVVENETTSLVTEVASGASTPFDMMSLPRSTGMQVVYSFSPDLGNPRVDHLPADNSLWWWVDWYSDMGGAKVLWGQNYAANSGEFFPPRLGLPITNPIDIEMVMPQFAGPGQLVIIALFNSPFGSYDVPLESAHLEIVGPDGKVIATSDSPTVTWMQKAAREQQDLLGVTPEAALARGQATWLWNYLQQDTIQPGEYTIRVHAGNLQGHATQREAFVTLEEGLGQGEVTSSLGGMFTFSLEDIKELEECHGCHDPATGKLREGVGNLTKAEAEAQMQEAMGLASGEPEAKDTPVPAGLLLAAILVALARRRWTA